jgi:hypothetical protein
MSENTTPTLIRRAAMPLVVIRQLFDQPDLAFETLQSLASEPRWQAAIAQNSPEMLEALWRYVEKDDPAGRKKERQTARKWLQLLLRMSVKVSPFGRQCQMLWPADKESPVKRETEINRALINTLKQKYINSIEGKTLLYANGSFCVAGDEAFWFDYRNGAEHLQTSTENNELLAAIENYLPEYDGVPLEDLIFWVAEATDSDKDEVLPIIASMLEVGAIYTEPMQEEYFTAFQQLNEIVAKLPANTPTEIVARLQKLNNFNLSFNLKEVPENSYYELETGYFDQSQYVVKPQFTDELAALAHWSASLQAPVWLAKQKALRSFLEADSEPFMVLFKRFVTANQPEPNFELDFTFDVISNQGEIIQVAIPTLAKLPLGAIVVPLADSLIVPAVGDRYIVQHQTHGFGRLEGRFIAELEQINPILERFEQAKDRFVGILDGTTHHAADAHLFYTAHLIQTGAYVNSADEMPVGSLEVEDKSGVVSLTQGGEMIYPIDMSVLAPQFRSSIYRFLLWFGPLSPAMITVRTLLRQQFESVNESGIRFMPRVEMGNHLVVYRKTWVVPFEQLILTDIESFMAQCAQIGCPTRFFCTIGHEKPMLYDLDLTVSADLLLRILVKGQMDLEIQEALPDVLAANYPYEHAEEWLVNTVISHP